MKYLKIFAYVIFCLAIVVIVSYITLGLSDKDLFSSIKQNLAINIGDFLWGTVGVFLTFTSTLLMILTFHSQQKQFRKTREDSFRTRFEGTFFNMLSMFSSVRAEADKQVEYSTNGNLNNLNDFYLSLKKKYEEHIANDKDFADSMNVLDKAICLSTESETAIYDLGDFYDKYVQEKNCNTGFYFRFVHNLITFVLWHWKNHAEDIHMYLNFIQAQMSDEELALVFYDCISKKGLDKNRKYTFMNNLDEYSFLENISESILLSRNHYKIFPKTMFGFLNSDERKQVKCNTRK